MGKIEAGLPTRTLELLSVAISDFLMEPENEARFDELDLVIHMAAAKWCAYSLSRRMEGAENPMPYHSASGDR